MTFNNFKLTLVGRGNGGTLDIGGTAYTTTPDDRFDVLIEFPKTTPYIGVGYGHHAAEPGWGFVFDAGASIGRAKVTGSASGPNLSGNVTQADIDRELYAAILDDPSSKGPLVLFSTEGGMDIEEVNAATPDRVFRATVDVRAGLDQAAAEDLIASSELDDAQRKAVAEALRRSEGNQSRAAELLGITRTALYRRLRRLANFTG